MTLDDLTVAPWHRFQWGGELRSIDGTSAADFTREDVAELVACSAGWDVWDGIARVVVGLPRGEPAVAQSHDRSHGFRPDWCPLELGPVTVEVERG